MSSFNIAAFEEVAVLPPERVRHHLARLDEGLSNALENGFRAGEFEADNLITQAQLLGFTPLAGALLAAFYSENASSEAARRSAQLAIAEARPKLAELLRSDCAA